MNLLKKYLEEKKKKSVFGWMYYYPLKWLIESVSGKSADAGSKFSYTLY
jgi:hypothetical protein